MYLDLESLGKPSIKKNGIFHDIWQKGGWVPVSNQISFVCEIMTFGWVPNTDNIKCADPNVYTFRGLCGTLKVYTFGSAPFNLLFEG